MANQIKIGEKAPDFTLPDVDMKPVSLKDFWGKKVVLAFFIGAFTETCTKEACEFRDAMSRLVDLKAQVIGIDLTAPFSSKRFSEKNRLSFPILSDPTREVSEKYGLHFSPCNETECCWGTSCYPIVKRSILVLDEEGIVRCVWVSSKTTTEPNYEEIQKAIDQIH
jgi:glutaredoxin-dependent peroxiredoxin